MRILLGLALVATLLTSVGATRQASAKIDSENPPLLALAVGERAVWAWASDYRLVRVNPARMRITDRVDTRPGALLDLAVGEGGVWGAGPCGRPRCDYGVLMRFDPATGRRTRPLTRLGLNVRAVATGYGSVWVLGGRRVLRVDPVTRRMVGRPIAVGRGARDIAAGAGAIWVTTGARPGPTGAPLCDLVGIDPRTGRVVRRQPIPCPGGRLAVGSGSVWAASPSGRGIVGVLPLGRRLPLPGVQLDGESVDVATGLDAVWVTGVRDIDESPHGERLGRALLSRLDADGRVVGRPLSLGPAHAWLPRIAAGAGAVWVANTPTGTVTRIDPDDGAMARVRVPAGR